jgi:hypothetical protein
MGMPFGFDPHEAERQVRDNVEVEKVYVDVILWNKINGQLVPLYFTWTDDRKYKIEKILDIRKGHSLKAFAPGWRYRCQTGRWIFYLHYDMERWYIEKTGP